jgi:hypothetical protein
MLNQVADTLPLPAMKTVMDPINYFMGNKPTAPSGLVPGMYKEAADITGIDPLGVTAEQRVAPRIPKFTLKRQ